MSLFPDTEETERDVRDMAFEDDVVKRLRSTRNWMKEMGANWKDAVCFYDRTPFEAADEIETLRARIAEAHALLRETLEYCMDVELTEKVADWCEKQRSTHVPEVRND